HDQLSVILETCIVYWSLLSFPTQRSSDLWRYGALPSYSHAGRRSCGRAARHAGIAPCLCLGDLRPARHYRPGRRSPRHKQGAIRSEEHTSELQSQSNLVCTLLLEKEN